MSVNILCNINSMKEHPFMEAVLRERNESRVEGEVKNRFAPSSSRVEDLYSALNK